MQYIFFDVETALGGSCICQMGAIVTDEKLEIISSISSLVNPGVAISHFTKLKHGISDEDVADAPFFPEIWNRFETTLDDEDDDYIFVCHNARSADLSILDKDFQRYGLGRREFKYYCTFEIACEKMPFLENRRLETLCEHFEIPYLNKHDALADARACYLVFKEMVGLGYADLGTIGFYNPDEGGSKDHSGGSRKIPATIDGVEFDFGPIDFYDSEFAITGTFKSGMSREKAAEMIWKAGGIFNKGITKTTGYLIFGSAGSANYSSMEKYTKARKYNESGVSEIIFITEEHFLDALENGTVPDLAEMSEKWIRGKFGFTKAKQLVYKNESERPIVPEPVVSMKCIQIDEDLEMGSLMIELGTGEVKRICSGYLKEMQSGLFPTACSSE